MSRTFCLIVAKREVSCRCPIDDPLTIVAGSLYLGADPFIGPFCLAAGLVDGGRSALYLYVGRSFDVRTHGAKTIGNQRGRLHETRTESAALNAIAWTANSI